MANHGYCKKCFWYKVITKRYWKFTENGMAEFPSSGRCYMQNGNNVGYKEVTGNNYCPYYYNRNRTKKKLDDFIENQGKLF